MKGVRFTKAFIKIHGEKKADAIWRFLRRPEIVTARLLRGTANKKIPKTFIPHYRYFLAYIVAEALPFSFNHHEAQTTGRYAIMITCTDHLNTPYFWQTYDSLDIAKAVLKLFFTGLDPHWLRNAGFKERQYK